MITPEQLATIKDRFEYLKANQSTTHHFCIVDYSVLLAEIEHLTATLTTKDRVLSQFADSENWSGVILGGRGTYMLWLRENPLDIANQALSEGKE